MVASTGNRKPWAFSARDYPAQRSASERLMFLLRYAVLAPSIYNTQPWRFIVYADRIEIYPDSGRHLAQADADARALRISLGCALENLIIAAEYFEYGWQALLSGSSTGPLSEGEASPAAVLRLLPGCPMENGRDPALFDVITTRRTWSGLFNDAAISSEDAAWLEEFCIEPGIGFHAVLDNAVMTAAAELGSQARAIQNARKDYRDESAAWSAANRGWRIRGFSFDLIRGLFGRGSSADPLSLGETGASGSNQGLVLITAADRSAASCLSCGQAYQRMSLAAANLGIAFQPIDALMQVESLRPALMTLFDSDAEPLLLFRLGYVPGGALNKVRKSPRLPVDSVAAVAG